MKPVHTDQNMPGRKDSKDKAGGRPRGPAHTMTNATSRLNGCCAWRLMGGRLETEVGAMCVVLWPS